MSSLFKQPVDIDFKKDNAEVVAFKVDFNYNSLLGQDYEKINEIFRLWIEEHGGDCNKILEEAGYYKEEVNNEVF